MVDRKAVDSSVKQSDSDSAGTQQSSKKTNATGRRRALRLHGSIARDLGVQIVTGRYKEGEILGNEVLASDRLQVSRGAYREAVRILAAKGLVESRPKVGTRVSEVENWHLLDPDVISWIFEFEPSEKMVVDLFELRQSVEPRAAALAAQRRTDEHLQVMSEALDDMSKYTLAVEEGRLADEQFHNALLSASDNLFLISMTKSISAAVAWTTIYKQRNQPLPRDPIPDHVEVFEAIKASDADAACSAMEKLVQLALQDTTGVGENKTDS